MLMRKKMRIMTMKIGGKMMSGYSQAPTWWRLSLPGRTQPCLRACRFPGHHQCHHCRHHHCHRCCIPHHLSFVYGALSQEQPWKKVEKFYLLIKFINNNFTVAWFCPSLNVLGAKLSALLTSPPRSHPTKLHITKMVSERDPSSNKIHFILTMMTSMMITLTSRTSRTTNTVLFHRLMLSHLLGATAPFQGPRWLSRWLSCW